MKDFKIEVAGAAAGKKAYNKIIIMLIIILLGSIAIFAGIKTAGAAIETIKIKGIKRIETTDTGALIHFKDNGGYYIEYIWE